MIIANLCRAVNSWHFVLQFLVLKLMKGNVLHWSNFSTFHYITSSNLSSGRAADPITTSLSNILNNTGSLKFRQDLKRLVKFCHDSLVNLALSKLSCNLISSVLLLMLVAWFQLAFAVLKHTCDESRSRSAKKSRACDSKSSSSDLTKHKN